MPKMTSGRYSGAHYGETFTEIAPNQGPPKMTKHATQAAAPSAQPFSKEDFVKIGIALGEIDKALQERGFTDADIPEDPIALVTFARSVIEGDAADMALAGHRIPKGARQPVRRRTLDVHGLSARELAMCQEKKLDPATYAAKKAAARANKKGGAK